jgi:tetratricopeptide (TPR) repeat protein
MCSAFKSDNSYKPFKPISDVSGYFQSGEDVNYITLTTEQRSDDPFRTIFHEYVHLLVNNTMGRNVPIWFNEGLAEFYSTFRMEEGNRKVILGDVVSNHVLYLREQKMIPLRVLFSVEHDSPQYNETSKRGVFYAESWALMHYLIEGNKGQRKEQLGRFISLLTANVPPEKAFQQAFQTSYEVIEKELRDYVQRTSYAGTFVEFPNKLEFDADMQSAPITEAEAQAYLGDLLLHTHRLNDAETRLQQALTLEPNLPMAHASLGMVRVYQNRVTEARQELQRAVAANSQNYLTHYYYAFALSREGMDGATGMIAGYSPEAAETMRAELRKAIELSPTFPESYSLFAFINMVRGEQLDESLAMLKRALAVAPGKADLSFMLAQIYMHKQDFKAAREILQPLVNSPNTERQLRDHAQSLLAQAVNAEEQMARFKAENDSTNSNAGSETPHLQRRRDAKDSDAAQDVETSTATSVDPMSYMEEALRKPQAGETRTSGTLIRIECNARGIFFVIKAGEQLLKFQTAAFDKMDISTYTQDVSGEITCGPRPKENTVVLTYLPSKDARLKVDGVATAIEFVPKEFKLKK